MIRSGRVALLAFLPCLFAAPAAAQTKARAPDPAKAVKALVKQQVEALKEENPYEGGHDTPWYGDETAFYVDAAEDGERGGIDSFLTTGPMGLVGGRGNKVKALKVVVAADKESAWAAFLAQGPGFCIHEDCADGVVFRATELFVKVEGEWKIRAAMWSVGMPDGVANASAMDGSAPAPAALADDDGEDAGEGPKELLDAIAAPLRKGAAFSDAISARADLEAFGSAPGERVVGGKGLQKAWKGWGPNLTVDGKVRAGLAPSGTTGWVAANLRLAKSPKGKKSYAVAFRAFFLCEKEPAGWRVVAAHLAVPRSGEPGM